MPSPHAGDVTTISRLELQNWGIRIKRFARL